MEENNIMKKQFEIIENSSTILETFLDMPFDESDISVKALRELVKRSQKDLQGVILLATSGLVVQALALARNLVEIELLLRYFDMQPNEITMWWNVDKKRRMQRYSAKRLREEITKKYPEMKQGMENDYWGHSELFHPTPPIRSISYVFKIETLFFSSQKTQGIPITIADTSQHALRIAELVGHVCRVINPEFDVSNKLNELKKLSSSIYPQGDKARA